MKQSIVDVIAYLLEMTAVRTFESENIDEHGFVRQELEEAGFSKDVVASTFDWLKELIEQKSWCVTSDNESIGDASNNKSGIRTFRIFDTEEQVRISMEVRNFILSLEHSGILDTRMREVVISQLMKLNQEEVELVDVKWVVLLVLMNEPNRNMQNMRSYLLATMPLDE